MSPESIYVSGYLFADRVIGSLLSATPEGLVLSIDVGGSLFDTVARDSARSSLHNFVESPSLARSRSNQRGRGTQPGPADIIDEPVVFGRIDGVMRLEDDSEIFESYAQHLEEVATRSIDNWANNRPGIRHIHFGDPCMTMDQLAGAADTLAHGRPTTSFYTSGLDRSRLLSALELNGYRALDVGANDVKCEASDSMTDFGWIAFPSERQAEVLSALPDETTGGIAQFFEWQDVIQRNAPVRQQRSRAVFGLPAHALPLGHKFATSEIIIEDDCYPVESDGTNSWRWLGPRSRTRLVLPCPIPGIYQVEIIVIASHLRNGLGGCRVLVEGREVRATIHGGDQGTIRFTGQIEAHNYTGGMIIDLVSPGAVSSAESDPRALRLNIQSIEVSPWQ
jgi:hypothetical protein